MWKKLTILLELFYFNHIEQLENFVGHYDQLEVWLPCSRLLTGIQIPSWLKNFWCSNIKMTLFAFIFLFFSRSISKYFLEFLLVQMVSWFVFPTFHLMNLNDNKPRFASKKFSTNCMTLGTLGIKLRILKVLIGSEKTQQVSKVLLLKVENGANWNKRLIFSLNNFQLKLHFLTAEI